MNNIKVNIHRNYNSNSIEVWAIKESSKYNEVNMQFDAEGHIHEQEFSHEMFDDKVQPLIRLPMSIADNVMAAIIEFYNGIGVKPGSVSLIEGKLIATENHLKDLQKIVFKNHKP